MLSRVADALFWMSRYLERAEHVTRLLDVWFFVELDLRAVAPGSTAAHWQSLATVLQQPLPDMEEGVGNAPIMQGFIFELDNPASIMSCVSRARSNARGVRGSINAEIWRALNKLYWQLSDASFRAEALDSPHEFFQVVEAGSQLFQGACDATLDHDEGCSSSSSASTSSVPTRRFASSTSIIVAAKTGTTPRGSRSRTSDGPPFSRRAAPTRRISGSTSDAWIPSA